MRRVFQQKVAKYASQHDPYRFYIIDYKADNEFATHTYENGKLLGTGQGKYDLFNAMTIPGALLQVNYESIPILLIRIALCIQEIAFIQN